MSDFSNQTYQTPPAKPNSNMALVSLILGILGWTILPTLGSIAAIITGHMAKNEIKSSMGAAAAYWRVASAIAGDQSLPPVSSMMATRNRRSSTPSLPASSAV